MIAENEKPVEKNNKEKKVNGKNHTLYIKEEKLKPKRKKIDGKWYTSQSKYFKKYRMFISDFMEDGPTFHDVLNELWNAEDDDELELLIHSHGGIVTEGTQLYQIIKNKFKNRTTSILHTMGYSMGALAFCMGDKRIVFPDSEIMFHDYSGGIFGKGGEIEARQKFVSKRLRKLFKSIVVDQKFLSKKEFKKMTIGQDYWFDADEMLKRGIATHIVIEGELIPSKKYLKKAKNGKNKSN